MNGNRLKALLAAEKTIVVPGIYDHISLLIANQLGFEALYASGYWSTASAMGEPDVGIAGYSEFIRIFSGFADKSSAPIIADADTGFGGIANLAHAVLGYQRAEIAAIQIEDQPFPKICGHAGLPRSVPTDEMQARVRVAVEARGEGDMLLVARTDARQSEGLASAIERLRQYSLAGADVLFLEAPASEDEIKRASALLDKPLLINAAHGGKTPVLAPQEYAALGVKIVIYPAGPPLSAAKAAAFFYSELKSGRVDRDAKTMFDFSEISRLLGMDKIVDLQKRHGHF